MNGIKNDRACNPDKPFPGCLGRMVNLFDLSTGVAANRLLADKPHRDCDGGRSYAARMNPIHDHIEDKVIVSELKRSSSEKKSNGTPMKTLIAQEMSKEVESKCNPPSVVARLMGLDAFPQQQPEAAMRRSNSRAYSRSHSDIPLGYWQQEHVFLDTQTQREVHQCQKQNEYRDVYEVWQQSQKVNYVRDKSPQKGLHDENTTKKKMALIRDKFIEAKRLSTDEKLRQSKQFQDAVEVLSSNKDLFLKFLQEPNSLFLQHLHDLQSIPPPPETKRITVLKPSKMVDNSKLTGSRKNDEKQMYKPSQVGEVFGWDESIPQFSPTSWRTDNNPTQPTRIVVLKPSPGKPHNIHRAMVSPPSLSPKVLGEEFYGEPEDDEAQESREVAKEITQQMRENLSANRRDETLLSSGFSNGYVGDDSSFNKSENEYIAGNLSDSEVMSMTSRHSWDCINRFGSPYSSLSLSRASYSPESSVCREAKRRLSERWALMASNGSCQEQRHVRRSSSTLGEMLALSETRKSMISEEEGRNNEQELKGSPSCLSSDLNKDESVDCSPVNLLRSKSVPVSSTVCGRPNVETSNLELGKMGDSCEVTKMRSMKSSLKGKVSSLFFSKNKRISKEISNASQSKDGSKISAGIPVHYLEKVSDEIPPCFNDSGFEGGLSPALHGSLSKMSYPESIGGGPKQGIVSQEAGFSMTKPVASANPSENQDQPSPISVLEPPFEEDDNTTLESMDNIKPCQQGAELLGCPVKTNLIDKSPPIESIARTLSWDDSCMETTTSYPLESYLSSQGAEEEEPGWPFFVQTLLSAAGLDGDMRCESFFARWHSPESPLDPSLRDKYVNLNDKELMHTARQRQWKSTAKLAFDCVNAVLVEVTGHGSDTSTRATSCGSPIVEDLVWAQLKEWFSSELSCVSDDGGDSNCLLLEMMVRKEVVGKGWDEHTRLEIDNIGEEIEVKLLEELVQEAVVQLTGGL